MCINCAKTVDSCGFLWKLVLLSYKLLFVNIFYPVWCRKVGGILPWWENVVGLITYLMEKKEKK